MKDLLVCIAKGLVENPDAVSVDVDDPNAVSYTHLDVYKRQPV